MMVSHFLFNTYDDGQLHISHKHQYGEDIGVSLAHRKIPTAIRYIHHITCSIELFVSIWPEGRMLSGFFSFWTLCSRHHGFENILFLLLILAGLVICALSTTIYSWYWWARKQKTYTFIPFVFFRGVVSMNCGVAAKREMEHFAVLDLCVSSEKLIPLRFGS